MNWGMGIYLYHFKKYVDDYLFAQMIGEGIVGCKPLLYSSSIECMKRFLEPLILPSVFGR